VGPSGSHLWVVVVVVVDVDVVVLAGDRPAADAVQADHPPLLPVRGRQHGPRAGAAAGAQRCESGPQPLVLSRWSAATGPPLGRAPVPTEVISL